MPTQEELDTKAHDYGLYVAKIPVLKQQAEELQTQLDDLNAQIAGQNKVLTETQAALPPLRDELVQVQKNIEESKATLVETQRVEDIANETTRKQLSDQASEIEALAKEVEKRSFDVSGREQEVRDALVDIEDQKTKIINERDQNADKANELDAALKDASKAKADAEKAMLEATTLVEETNKRIVDAENAEANARADRLAAEEAAGKANADMLEAKSRHELNEKVLKEVRPLIAVEVELRQFIMEHLQNPDAVKAYIADKFPSV